MLSCRTNAIKNTLCVHSTWKPLRKGNTATMVCCGHNNIRIMMINKRHALIKINMKSYNMPYHFKVHLLRNFSYWHYRVSIVSDVPKQTVILKLPPFFGKCGVNKNMGFAFCGIAYVISNTWTFWRNPH